MLMSKQPALRTQTVEDASGLRHRDARTKAALQLLRQSRMRVDVKLIFQITIALPRLVGAV